VDSSGAVEFHFIPLEVFHWNPVEFQWNPVEYHYISILNYHIGANYKKWLGWNPLDIHGAG